MVAQGKIDILADARKDLAEKQQALRVSEEKRAAQAEQLRALYTTLNTAGIGITRCNRDLRYLEANQTFATIAGLPLGEIIGRPVIEVLGETAFTTIRPYIDRVLAGERVEYESVIPYPMGKEGSLFRVVSVPDLDPDGSVIGLVGCVSDITSSKQAEARLAERNVELDLAGKIARIGRFTYDDATQKLQISPGCAVIYGLPDGTLEISREDWRALVHPDDLPGLDAIADHAFSNGETEFVREFRILRHGKVRWIESRVLISYNEIGRPVRRIGAEIDVTERKSAEERQRSLNAELDHRVKNTLATVSAVVSHTRQGNRSVANFAAALEGRIRSMATAHELLSFGRWQGLSLTELVQREVAPYATGNNTEINGPKVVLTPEAGQAMAVVLHELTTNAAKYGALSARNGRVSIRWGQRRNGQSRSHLLFEWQEIGGPPVEAPGKPSYGTSTIRDLIPYEFGGAVELVLAPEGVRCRLELPSDWLSNDVERVPGEGTHTPLSSVST